MKLTVENLSNLVGFQINDSENILSSWSNVEIENPVLSKNGNFTDITFTVVKSMKPYNSYAFGGKQLTLTLEDNEIYDF